MTIPRGKGSTLSPNNNNNMCIKLSSKSSGVDQKKEARGEKRTVDYFLADI